MLSPNTGSIFVYGFFIANLFLVLVLVWVVNRYRSLLEEVRRAKTEKQKIEKESRAAKKELLDRAEDKLDQDFANLVETIQTQAQKIANQASAKTEKEINQEIDFFRARLEKEFLHFQEANYQGLEEKQQQVETEIEEYKRQRIEKINQEIEKLVQSLAQEVLAKSLSPKDHQELIEQALDQAKKEGLFSQID